MKSIKQMNRKGQALKLASGVVIGFLVLILIMFVVLFAVSSLNPTSFFTAGSGEANATKVLTQNLTTGVASFGKYIPITLLTLGLVIVLAVLVVVIFYVRRFESTGGGGGAL